MPCEFAFWNCKGLYDLIRISLWMKWDERVFGHKAYLSNDGARIQFVRMGIALAIDVEYLWRLAMIFFGVWIWIFFVCVNFYLLHCSRFIYRRSFFSLVSVSVSEKRWRNLSGRGKVSRRCNLFVLYSFKVVWMNIYAPNA